MADLQRGRGAEGQRKPNLPLGSLHTQSLVGHAQSDLY